MAKKVVAPAKVFAIVLAAGQSRRMGRSKQLMEIGGQPMLKRLTTMLLEGGTDHVFVVTTRVIARALTLEAIPNLHLTYNDNTASEMIDSVRIGLAAITASAEGPPAGVLVCPTDHPGLTNEDIRACIDAFRAAPDRVIIAAYRGRRGHPMIFPMDLARVVQSEQCDEGVYRLWWGCADRLQLVERPHDGVVRDVDTPEDLV